MTFQDRSTRRRLNDIDLHRSATVANCDMNRERDITGTNSYAADLRFDPLEFLSERLKSQQTVAWLDLCCGSGKALIQAGKYFADAGVDERVSIHGVDLVSMFVTTGASNSCVTFAESSAMDFQPAVQYDLITCVHGLHYIGDKLGVVALAASWLKSDGLFMAHLDFNNVKLTDGRSCNSLLGRELKRASVCHDRRHHLITIHGHQKVDLPFQYEGADDQAGPNFTGQAAVDSHYTYVAAKGDV